MSLPALALLEIETLSRGFVVADAVVKRAPVKVLSAGPVTPGKYLLLLAGEVAELEEAWNAGRAAADSQLLDSLFLPQAHPALAPAAQGRLPRDTPHGGAAAIIETQTVASALLAADRALKAAEVRLIQAGFARGLGGKGYFVLAGELHDVEAALEAATRGLLPPLLLATELIAQPSGELDGTVF